jgi:hypothetical protein
MATGYGLDNRRIGVPSPGRDKNLLLSASSRPALESTQPHVQWVPGAPPPSDNYVKLTAHLQLLPKSRKRGSIHPLDHTSSWRGACLIKHRVNFYNNITSRKEIPKTAKHISLTVSQAQGVFSYFTAPRYVPGPTQPPNQWVPWALSLGVKRPGREADYSSPSSAEFKNGEAIHVLPHMCSCHGT